MEKIVDLHSAIPFNLYKLIKETREPSDLFEIYNRDGDQFSSKNFSQFVYKLSKMRFNLDETVKEQIEELGNQYNLTTP